MYDKISLCPDYSHSVVYFFHQIPKMSWNSCRLLDLVDVAEFLNRVQNLQVERMLWTKSIGLDDGHCKIYVTVESFVTLTFLRHILLYFETKNVKMHWKEIAVFIWATHFSPTVKKSKISFGWYIYSNVTKGSRKSSVSEVLLVVNVVVNVMCKNIQSVKDWCTVGRNLRLGKLTTHM